MRLGKAIVIYPQLLTCYHKVVFYILTALDLFENNYVKLLLLFVSCPLINLRKYV